MCGQTSLTFLNDTNLVIFYDGESLRYNHRDELLQMNDLNEASSQINLVHYKEILSEVDLYKIIHWENDKREFIKVEDKKIIINGFKVNFTGTGVSNWLYEKYTTIKDEFNSVIIRVGSIIVILVILVVIIITLIKFNCFKIFNKRNRDGDRRRRASKRRYIDAPNTTDESEPTPKQRRPTDNVDWELLRSLVYEEETTI